MWGENMGLLDEKMAFYTNLEYLGKEIRHHRDAIISKDIIFNDINSINEMVNTVKVFKDKINILKKNIVLKDLKDDVDKYFASEVCYLDNITNAMRVILKNINNNVHSDNFVMENNLLFQTALISKLSSDIDDLEKSSLYYSFFTPKSDGVTTIDGKNIKVEDVDKYYNLNKYLECTKKKFDSLENEIDNLNINNEDHKFIPNNGESMIEKDLKRIDEILKSTGRKKTVTVLGKSYYVSRSDAKEFRTLMLRINKYNSNQDNSMPIIIDNPIFSIKNDEFVVRKRDKYKYVGKITGVGTFYDSDFLERHSDNNYKYVGTIGKVENYDEEEVVFSTGRDKSTHHKFNNKNKIVVFENRKSKNIKKLRKNIITASVALVMSLVTVVSAYGVSLFNFGKKDDNIINTTKVSLGSSDKADSNYDSVKKQNAMEFGTSFNNHSYNDTVYDVVKREMISEAAIRDVSNNNNNFVDDNVELFNKQINIDDSIVVNDDALIYKNCIDASNCNYGLNPYYDNDVERTVRGVAFKSNDSIVYTYTQDDYNNLLNSGAEVSAVCCDDGFYNINDVINVNDNEVDNKILVNR